MNTQTLRLSIFAIAGTLALSGCGVGQASATDPGAASAETPVPVEISQPYHADISATYTATAAITSDADAPVVARAGGELVELLAEEGDKVEAGQVLARLDGERLRLEMLAAKANLARASKEYRRNIDLNKRGLISASMFEGLKYELAALEAGFKLRQLDYEYATIRAPIAGVVSSREIKPGQNVAMGDVVFRITETTELLAYLQIPQSELPKFQAGHSATLRVASMPDARFAATIVRISPTIDTRNGTFRATLSIPNSKGDLAPGMFGNFSIAYEKHADALLIPAAALLDEDSEAAVYVVTEGEVVRRVIETGFEVDGRVEVLGGLTENDQVVVTGQSGLRDGSKVLASNRITDSFSG